MDADSLSKLSLELLAAGTELVGVLARCATDAVVVARINCRTHAETVIPWCCGRSERTELLVPEEHLQALTHVMSVALSPWEELPAAASCGGSRAVQSFGRPFPRPSSCSHHATTRQSQQRP